MIPILNIATRAVRQASQLMIEGFEKINNLFYSYDDEYKNILIKQIVISIEKKMVEVILQSYPNHSINAKNIGNIYGKNKFITWIIDPINGILNYKKGFPFFTISIAIKIKEITEITLIYDAIRNELFSCIRGRNAQINGYRLRINKNKKINDIILVSNMISLNQKYISILKKNLNKKIELRNTGSPSLNFAYLSSGRIDCYIESNLNIWDITAGELLLRESGGILTDFSGNNNYLLSGNIIAGNIDIVKNILILINNK